MESTIELSVLKKEIHFVKKDSLTTGQQRNSMKISFKGKEWNGLTKYGVFKVEDIVKDVLIIGPDIEIPTEVCTIDNLGKVVYFGIKGIYTETISETETETKTETVYTTPYFRLGVLERGTETSGSIPEYPTQNAIDAAIENARRWAVGPSSTDKVPTDTNNAKYWSDQANTEADRAETAAESVKGSVEAAVNSAQEAEQYAKNAKTAVSEYPRIDSHGHWERYDPESGKWVDTGALAQFTIFRTYDSIDKMYANWDDLHKEYYNNFVLIASEPKKDPGKKESIEDDNGKLFIILKEKNAFGNEYQQNGFSCVGDLSGAQGIKGESAYDTAKAGGYQGSEEKFAELLYNAVSNESSRVDAENLRKTAESSRATAETLREQAETQRNSNEETREKAESSRKESEGLRASEEEKRKSAESERKTAEDSRVEAENIRNTSEDSRVKAESGRASAETARETAESDRVDAESKRVAVESGRVNAESGRVTTENERVAAESTRAKKETERQNSETNRGKAENARVEAENARVTAENSRVNAESGRITAEDARNKAETNRQTEEGNRVKAETDRTSAEQIRINNEAARQSNEDIRRANEAAREVWENYIRDKTYYNGNKVSLNGNSYVCVVESTTNHPDQSNDWLLIAQRGDGLVIKDKYTTIEDLRAANPNHTYTYQVEQPNSEFYIYSDIASDWVSIGALGSYTAGTGIEIIDGVISATAEVYKAGDGISITNSSISALLGSGLKFDTEKKITLDESVFVEYTNDEITNFYNTVTV